MKESFGYFLYIEGHGWENLKSTNLEDAKKEAKEVVLQPLQIKYEVYQFLANERGVKPVKEYEGELHGH